MVCCLSVAGYAQTAASYGLTATTGSYATISGTGTAISSGGMTTLNGVNTSIPIGFSFVFCGTTYTSASASSNGWFSLANSALAASPSGTNATGSLSSIASGVGLLMPMWSSLYGVSQSAYYQTTGTVGSRIFTMEWKNWGVCCATGTAALNFQIKLYEGTNTVEFWYGPYSGSVPSTATIGIGNTTSDYQTLPAGTSTFSNTSFNVTCSPPANGTLLRWCAPPPAITGGTTAFCQGATTTLADAQAGGVWSSGAPSVATVGSGSGIVTGVSGGTALISYTPACGPVVTKTVTVNPLPTTYTVTGGGGYCAGGSGAVIGLNNSTTGVVYTLYDGFTAITPTVNGTGAAISFVAQTTAGTYTVQGSIGTCTATMLGSVGVTVNPLPTQFAMTGGGPYCLGGTGAVVGIAGSTIGVNYQLYAGGTPVGAPSVGTGSAFSFGSQTITTSPTTFSIIGTNGTTGCTATMISTVNVTTSPLPTIYTVTGGGNMCTGGTGLAVGLTNSVSGTTYQLFLTPTGSTTASPVGSPLSGTTGSSLNFGNQTVGGTYTVVATITSTGCTAAMSGSAVITVNSLPIAYAVSVSATSPNVAGAYCLGGSGQTISLLGSQSGVNYQLYIGSTPIGSPVAGTSTSISFGLQTTVGSYTVVGTNVLTGCVLNMTGSVSISTIALPPAFSVTGGGMYCAGGSGVAVGLASSSPSTSYSLYNSGTLVGAASGTGSAVNFGNETLAGTYSVTALSTTTGCTSNMSGSVGVTINPVPATFVVTNPGTSVYCAGTNTGVNINISGSQTGVNYLLYRGGTILDTTIAGTGSGFNFPNRLFAGSYSVVAVNATTTCSSNMTGSAIVTINPQPTVYTMTGGGGYCAGTAGVAIGLSASNTGINYQLYNTAGTVGAPVGGTGSPLSFGLITTSSSRDSVVATNTITGCTATMAGNVIVTVNALPTQYTVVGGGAYCFGGAGVPITLGNSQTGINYQLGTLSTLVGAPVSGTTGSPIIFNGITAPGTYIVTAVNTATGCTNNMLGGATVIVTPLPAVYTVTGGGTYCAGTGGVHVGLGSSATGVNYQLYFNGIPGATLAGTTGALDFGPESGNGTYTILATTAVGGCQSNMSGTAIVSVNVLPSTAYTISESATGYCAGGTGVTIGLTGSAIGVNYQLFNGATPEGAPMAGSSFALNFGAQTLAGTYTIVGSNASTGCFATMTGTAPVAINSLPSVHPVTGGGGYCPGTGGVSIGVNPTDAGVNYQLYNGLTAIGGLVPGIGGSSITFGTQTTPGIYTVVANNPTTGCSANMSGSATVSIYSLPLVYNVTGGGNYCLGGTGVNIGLSNSNVGISYQLMNAGAPMGSAIAGSGLPLSFGLQTVTGPYSVIATSGSTTCIDTMSGMAIVGTNALPAPFNVIGGGAYCAGGAGLTIGLDGSAVGTDYQLVIGGTTPVGTLVTGTGTPINFGLQTAGGTYTVVATNTATTCTTAMTGSQSITINTLPAVYTVSGGGAYCAGTTGVTINLSGSDATAKYQLVNGTPTGPIITGGGSISFSPVTAAGTYSIIATNLANSCTKMMTGTATVSINSLPNTYLVAGGGAYCSGGTGVHIMLSGSNSGINYQLKKAGVLTGSVFAGTGMALDFGLDTAGGIYYIQATNAVTGCTQVMTDSAIITINPLPVIHTVVSTSSSYCAGGAGVHVSIDGSNVGTNYQLYNGTTTVGPAEAGTGSALSFGYITFPGSYEIVATNTSTGCFVNMAPGVTVAINALPTVYAVTGGGNYCAGGTGVNVGVAGSNTGIMYKLYNGLTYTGDSVAGTGSPISFGLQTASGTYTVIATNTLTTCINNMSGSATIVINALPSSSYTSTGGGAYCAGGTGIALGLSGSALATDYQLMRGTATVGSPVLGTGSAISFGPQTAAGTYTVIATSTITSCSNTMSGSSVITINSVPSIFSVTGGGNFCPGGSGVNVGLSGSTTGVNYQLYNGSAAVGTAMAGISGSPINFGLQTAGGSYTVIATNTSTGCSNTMSGTAVVVVNALPTPYSLTGGGNYCAGGTGVAVGLSSSSTGVNYTLYNGSSSLLTMSGTGGPISFGLQTLAGTYSVLGTNSATSCTNYMSDSVTIVINPIVVPSVLITTSGTGDTVCSGTFTTFTANPSGGGVGPMYQWAVNGTPAATGVSYAYVPLNGDVVSVTLTSDATCAMPATATTDVVMTVNTKETPFVTVTAAPGDVVCQGTVVDYTATPTYGGPTPAYQWFKGASAVLGATLSTFSYTPANGDAVYVVMTSDYDCRLADNAGSAHINMVVDVPALPVVTITAAPGFNISNGETVTLTATVVNGGPLPTYQWLINGIPVGGATNSTYSNNTFNNKDSVTCQVLSSGGCPGLMGFNSITMHVANVGVKPVSLSGSDVVLIPNPNNGNFTLKGNLGTNSDDAVTIEVVNMLGQVVYTRNIIAGNGEINERIQLNSVANGMYLLNLRSGSENKVFHFVIEQ